MLKKFKDSASEPGGSRRPGGPDGPGSVVPDELGESREPDSEGKDSEHDVDEKLIVRQQMMMITFCVQNCNIVLTLHLNS